MSGVGLLEVVDLSLEVTRRLLMGTRDPGVDDLNLLLVLGTCFPSIHPKEFEEGWYVVKSFAFYCLPKGW